MGSRGLRSIIGDQLYHGAVEGQNAKGIVNYVYRGPCAVGTHQASLIKRGTPGYRIEAIIDRYINLWYFYYRSDPTTNDVSCVDFLYKKYSRFIPDSLIPWLLPHNPIARYAVQCTEGG